MYFLSHAHIFKYWRNILSWIPFGSDLDPNHVCKWRERERERLVQACQSKHCIGGSTSRERERERERKRDVCFLFNFVSLFFYSGFQSFVSIFAKKKSDRTRFLAVSILEYNLGPKITILAGIRSRQSERKRGRTK